MTPFLAFYFGGMLATALTVWAEAPALRVQVLPPGMNNSRLLAIAGALVLGWPVALVMVRTYWEQAVSNETAQATTVQVGILTTAKPIQKEISAAVEALRNARTLLDGSMLSATELSNLDVALEEVGNELDDLGSDIATAIAKEG